MKPKTLSSRYKEVCNRIDSATEKAGGKKDSVILVAVTKNAAIDQIRQLIELGHQDFGENRVQNLQKRIALVDEFIKRHKELTGDKPVSVPDSVRWHMIGHLQRNKVRKVIKDIRLIHSVDSLRLVEEIHACIPRVDNPVEVLIQVNVSSEKQKHGIAPAAVRHLIDQIDTMMGIRTRGMMCMAPYSENPEDSRSVFERCKELFDDIVKLGIGSERFDILSMGMSGDFEVAIECGANLVRVGSAIFGEPQEGEDQEE